MSLATNVGFCSLDRRRKPLTGLELRGCWEARPTAVEAAPSTSTLQPASSPAPLRGFVPLDEIRVEMTRQIAEPAIPFLEPRDAPTSLFGDAER